MSNGSDAIRFEQVPAIVQSFVPPIVPPVSGTPGANLYLQTNGSGGVSWAAKPTAEYESTSTSGAVTSVFSTKSPSDGATSYEVHWSAYTSGMECAAGETVIVIAKDPGNPPTIKATIPEIHHLGYAGTPTITASVVGNDVQFEANGLVLKDISWAMRIE